MTALSSGPSRPLVSFCVTVCNQERYVAAALEGAFRQTYRPIEIVISDDCSTDGTLAVVEQKISEYRRRGGDVPVVLSRNSENLGNLGNWLELCRLARGELLVKCDGDDVSRPDRTQRLVEAWLADGRRAKIVSSQVRAFDDEGRDLGLRSGEGLGAAQAYSCDLWRMFRDRQAVNRLAIDDVVFMNRNFLISDGRVLMVDEPLVDYRVGSGITTAASGYKARQLSLLRTLVFSADDIMCDIDEISKRGVPVSEHVQMQKRRLEDAEKHMLLMSSQTFRGRWSAFRSICHESLGSLALDVIYLFPDWVCNLALNPYDKIARLFRRTRT